MTEIKIKLDDKKTQKLMRIADYMNASIPGAIEELILAYKIPKNHKGGQE